MANKKNGWVVSPAALRSKMAKVTVTRPDGSTETFTVLREPLVAGEPRADSQ